MRRAIWKWDNDTLQEALSEARVPVEEGLKKGCDRPVKVVPMKVIVITDVENGRKDQELVLFLEFVLCTVHITFLGEKSMIP